MKTSILASILALASFANGVIDSHTLSNARMAKVPSLVLWAWERPEDLRFIDCDRVGVAYYAGTIVLKSDWASLHPRMNPLMVPDAAYIFPVFRIEESSSNVPEEAAMERASNLIVSYAETHRSKAVQIDYDARKNSRNAYSSLLQKLQQRLPEGTPISITSLASWCLRDKWLNKAKVDESVAMLFSMGSETNDVLSLIKREPLNSGSGVQSIGISLNEKSTNTALIKAKIQINQRRLYVFNSQGWTKKSYANCTEIFR